MTTDSAAPTNVGLGASARASLLWTGGFTLLRDVAQFGLMLLLVRLLSPADYGLAALVQSIIGFLSILSSSTFSQHALQIRDPKDIDWQVHFTASLVLNSLIFGLVLLISMALTLSQTYRHLSLELSALGVVFLVEIPGTLRQRMLEANHDWKRYRVLVSIGTLLGMALGLVVALAGGGVWALIVQPPMLSLPAAFDLLVLQRFKPDWGWSWARYRETVRFGLNRMTSGLLARGRTLSENTLLSGLHDLGTLGFFTRANGLATLLAGRIGSTAIMALYPVVTRAERGSIRFQRLAGLVLRGVCWTTVPAVVFLALGASDIVRLLYGARWESVVPLLPLAAAVSGIVGIWSALSGLLLANEDVRATLLVEMVGTVSAIVLAVILVPYGVRLYLAGLIVHGLLVSGVTIAVLLRKGAISAKGVTAAIGPAAVAGVVAGLSMFALRWILGVQAPVFVRVLLEGIAVGVSYLAVMRVIFEGQLRELLEVLPGGQALARGMLLVSQSRVAEQSEG